MSDARRQVAAEPHGPAPRRPLAGGPRKVALMNQKGGVGKTTTTVNLAAAIAERGRTVLVVDLDPQAHATLHLGVDSGGMERSVYDVLTDSSVEAASAILTVRPGLSLLPAEVDLAAAETELAAESNRHGRLEQALRSLGDAYDVVLMDCPPSLGLLTLNALAAADEVLMPMQAHFLALQGVGKLLETIALVSQGLNPRLSVRGVVLCAHDESTTHAREVVADLERFFEDARSRPSPWQLASVLRPAIRRNIKLAECPSFGQTVLEYAPWCPGALDYRKLSESLDDAWTRESAQPEPPTVSVASPGSRVSVGG